jgi:hypothetical protein
MEIFNHDSRTSCASRIRRGLKSSLPVPVSGARWADLRFLKLSYAAALLALLHAGSCLADARPKAITTWAFPAQNSRLKLGKATKAKLPLKVNYQAPAPNQTLGVQNVQAQQAAQRGFQQQLRQTQTTDKNSAR